MLQIKFTYIHQKSLKTTNTRWILSSILETTSLSSFQDLVLTYNSLQLAYFSVFFFDTEKREVANCVLKDMMHLICMWRQIRGYPQGGSTTHTNANTAKKNKLLLNFRIQQYYKLFGQKKRNIYPTLIKAEYNNRLWYYNWFDEWLHASFFARRMAVLGHKAGIFNPVLLAGNQTNGYKRVGKAAKIGKAKKLVKVYTLGVPLLFTRYIYLAHTPKGFPKIVLKDEVNKRLGKKLKKKEYKKK